MTEISREGEDSAHRDDILTASSAVSQAQEPQHSPLPWRLHYTNKWKNLGQNIYVRDAHDHYVTEQIRGDAEANAGFIVTACNSHDALLAALKALFADYKELADSGDAGNWTLEGLQVGQQALAAILNAEGSHV